MNDQTKCILRRDPLPTWVFMDGQNFVVRQNSAIASAVALTEPEVAGIADWLPGQVTGGSCRIGYRTRVELFGDEVRIEQDSGPTRSVTITVADAIELPRIAERLANSLGSPSWTHARLSCQCCGRDYTMPTKSRQLELEASSSTAVDSCASAPHRVDRLGRNPSDSRPNAPGAVPQNSARESTSRDANDLGQLDVAPAAAEVGRRPEQPWRVQAFLHVEPGSRIETRDCTLLTLAALPR